MRLTDLVELEAQIALERERDPEDLHARDRAIGAELEARGADFSDRDGLLSAWVDGLTTRGAATGLGPKVAAAHRLATYGLVLTGVALGWGTATVTLAYDGRDPINVLEYLLAVVGSQVVLLGLLVLGVLLARFGARIPVVGDVQAILGWMVRGLERRVEKASLHIDSDRRTAWQVVQARLRARASLYTNVERWVLLAMTQSFAVAFNAAVLLAGLRLVLFSDLAFAWNTTLELSTARFAEIVQAAGLPWHALWPQAVPSPHLVEVTRYSRLEGAYVHASAGRSADPSAVGQWWRFLVAATVAYGFLPRLSLLTAALIGRARALRRLPLDTPDVDRILRRMRAPRVRTQAEQTPTDGPDLSPARPVASASQAGAAGATVILWRDVPLTDPATRAVVRAVLDVEPGEVARAGGMDFAADGALLAGLSKQPGPVVLIAEAWEAPDKGTRRFLAQVRESLGPQLVIHVLLIGEADTTGPGRPAPGDLELWRDRLGLLGDPYLGVEAAS